MFLNNRKYFMRILLPLAVFSVLFMFFLTRRFDEYFPISRGEKGIFAYAHRLFHDIEFRDGVFIPASKWTEYETLNMTEKLSLLVKENASMKDPRLIDLIRKYYIEFPSKEPYALSNPTTLDYSCGQSSYINSLLNYKEKGFFVEAGAWLGEYASTSLYFEKSRGWAGLLVEPNPENFRTLKGLNRKAFHINACLSTHPFPVVLKLNAASDMSRTIERMEDKQWVQEHNFDQKPYYEVPCFPLYSIMLAINRTSIDYLGLDVEGNELQILKTIPFDDLDIKSLTAECLEMHGRGNESTKAVKLFLESRGFRCHGIIEASPEHSCFAEDLVFLKKDQVTQERHCEPIKNPFEANATIHNAKSNL